MFLTQKEGDTQENAVSLWALESVVPGRAFTRRFYFSMAKLKPHHHITLKSTLKADLKMWLAFLDHPSIFCCPFMDMSKTLNSREVNMYSDASRNHRLGFGVYCQKDWTMQQWQKSFIVKHRPSIAYLELFALVAGVRMWLYRFKNSRITVFCDNMSVVHMVNKNTSHCPKCLILIRMLVLHSMKLNVRVFARHVDTKANRAADLLSRLKIVKFWDEFGHKFNVSSTQVHSDMWPMEKVWNREF